MTNIVSNLTNLPQLSSIFGRKTGKQSDRNQNLVFDKKRFLVETIWYSGDLEPFYGSRRHILGQVWSNWTTLARFSNFFSKKAIKNLTDPNQNNQTMRKKFDLVVKFAVYVYWGTFSQSKILRKCYVYNFFSCFERNICARVVRTAIYLSRGTFWGVFI